LSKVWIVTGAGRGLGVDIVQKALAAGHLVVATGRKPGAVLEAVGAHENLLTVALDITDPKAAVTAAQAAVKRFGTLMYWSTMRATSMPVISKTSVLIIFGRRWRPTSLARLT